MNLSRIADGKGGLIEDKLRNYCSISTASLDSSDLEALQKSILQNISN